MTRSDRMNPDEPTAPDGPVVRPDYLSTGGIAVWDRESPICLAMGTLTPADVAAFATMCELVARFQANAIQAEPNPNIAVNTANSLKAYFDYFGMTPSGRSRIRIPKAEGPVSKWAGVIA